MSTFVHLHVHSYYSILDGMSSISGLIDKASKSGMNAIALTDHGNMFGVKEFFNYAKKKNSKFKDQIKSIEKELKDDSKSEEEKIQLRTELLTLKEQLFKPILGCEAYVARNGRKQKSQQEDRSGYHLVLLAKNKKGYENLCKLVSLAWMEGYYYRPRIDHEILELYSEGLIATSACLGGEIHKKVESGDLQGAEESIMWYKKVFGDDYYIELQRHKTDKPNADYSCFEKQQIQNAELIKLARKTNTKLVATNDVRFVEEEHGEAHERLICLSTGKSLDDPNRMRYTKQEWLKSPEQMLQVFADIPDALENTVEISKKVEFYDIDSAPMMPVFPIPEAFGTEEIYRQKFSEADLRDEFGDGFDRLGGYEKVVRVKLEADYLAKLAYEGAHFRYGEELDVEKTERIDFELNVMKTMGFPGYFLIVQDFIKAARDMGVSVGPGRGSAAGSVVAYCLRITDIDPLKYDLLFERFLNPDRISMPDIDIDFDDDGRGKVLDYITNKYGKDRVAQIISNESQLQNQPVKVEHTHKMFHPYETDTPLYPNDIDIHACGVVIGADDLKNIIPLCTAVDKTTGQEICVTQYPVSMVEETGLIKMDLLELATLSIIKETLSNIKNSKGIELDIDAIPLDDTKTFELFRKGLTADIFLFESSGMQKHLQALKPTQFEDLIAMNALYRPGSIKYIPQFVNRKRGHEPIEYPFPEMEQYLRSTYGITIFQEQIMLLSQKLAGFTRSQSDELRVAMSKEIPHKKEALKGKFIDGCLKNGYGPNEKLEKIWDNWTDTIKFASCKSHLSCYTKIAYQMAYLKAHYPVEFLTAKLANVKNIIN